MKLSDLSWDEFSHRLSSTGGLQILIGPYRFSLQVRLQELHKAIALLYADNEIADHPVISDFQITLGPHPAFPPWKKLAAFIIDSAVKFKPFAREMALPMLEWAINWCTFSQPHQYFMLHSASLEKNGRGLLLPGPPGAGKSTLCAALALRGWRLLSDELAMMRPGSTDLIPVPRPIGLKNASIEIIRTFEPGATIGPITSGTRKGTVAHLKPPVSALQKAHIPAKPRWIIFPAFKQDAPLALEPASKAQTFLWLAKDAFNFNVLGEKAFDALSALIDTCGCYELSYSDLNEAITFLDQLCNNDGGHTGHVGAH